VNETASETQHNVHVETSGHCAMFFYVLGRSYSYNFCHLMHLLVS
jgi:hypothetical protein